MTDKDEIESQQAAKESDQQLLEKKALAHYVLAHLRSKLSEIHGKASVSDAGTFDIDSLHFLKICFYRDESTPTFAIHRFTKFFKSCNVAEKSLIIETLKPFNVDILDLGPDSVLISRNSKINLKEHQNEAAAPGSTVDSSRNSYLAPSRSGKKQVTGYFDEAVVKSLKGLSLVSDKTMQSLLDEAIADLFLKHGSTIENVQKIFKTRSPM